MSYLVDAIRASMRILHAQARPTATELEAAARDTADRRPPEITSVAGHPARAGPSAVAPAPSSSQPDPREGESRHGHGGGARASSRDDDTARLRELWRRDMAVRAESARDEPDGSMPEIPAYIYDLGPDGRPYAAEVPQTAREPQQDDTEREDDAPTTTRRTDDASPTAARASTSTPLDRGEASKPEARAASPPTRDATSADSAGDRDADVRRHELEQAYHPPASTSSHFDLVA
jgi:hypothetical protein